MNNSAIPTNCSRGSFYFFLQTTPNFTVHYEKATFINCFPGRYELVAACRACTQQDNSENTSQRKHP